MTMPTRSQVRTQASRWLRLSLAALVAAGSTGCGTVEPWVKPYERDRLADPIMAFDRPPISQSYMQHVWETREGARGAVGGAGGGCGCN